MITASNSAILDPVNLTNADSCSTQSKEDTTMYLNNGIKSPHFTADCRKDARLGESLSIGEQEGYSSGIR